jgi:hypothetical protein
MTKQQNRPRVMCGPRDVLLDRIDEAELALAELRRVAVESDPPPRLWTQARWKVEQLRRYTATLADALATPGR